MVSRGGCLIGIVVIVSVVKRVPREPSRSLRGRRRLAALRVVRT